MANEAQNRHANFNALTGYPGLAMDVVGWEYKLNTKLWKDAMFRGTSWIGLPGLRGIGLGSNRSLTVGGGPFNKAGVGTVNRGIHSLLNLSQRYRQSGYNFMQQGISGMGKPGAMLGKALGGTQTGFLRIAQAPSTVAGREVVKNTLEKNWFASLFSDKVAKERVVQGGVLYGKKGGFKGSQYGISKGLARSIGTRGTAWKYAASQYLAPTLAWGFNLAFAASIAMPIFSAAGRFVAGQIDTAERFAGSLNNRSLEFGGKIHQSYMNRAGMTERQRALLELQKSRTNARTLMGNEAQLYHG